MCFQPNQKTILVFLLFLCICEVYAQEIIKKDTIRKEAKFEHVLKKNEIVLTPIPPKLTQIAGAPKAYYSYFWEFGDGYFSKEKSPKHTYREKGDYEVKLWVTNHYDSGKPPATRPQKVSIKDDASISNSVATMTNDFDLLTNRDPVPDEKMVFVMRYKNNKQYVTSGRLYLFYNERKYKTDNFEIEDIRTHNGEELVIEEESQVVAVDEVDDNAILYSSLSDEFEGIQQLQDSTKTDLDKTLKDSKEYYKNWSIFNFDNLNPNEERNVFFTLKTPPEMLKDTSAIITIRGVHVPDRNFKNHTVKEKEMEIVTSHDPNKMSSNGTILNYRLVKFKTVKYKIQFQNDGEGPAKTIRLETDIPDMYDKSTIKVVDMYPKAVICPKKPVSYSCLDTTFTEKQAIFTFKNIYLPGSNQKGVQEKDSTKGFVKYSIKFGDDFHKRKTVSKTAIIFDKNEPIITNRSTTRFLPGISVGAKVGYNWFTNLNDSRSYFVGATISPFKSYRWYWQLELLNSLHSYKGNIQTTEVTEDLPAVNIRRTTRTSITSDYSNVDVEIPLLVRYNVNNYIGLGAGVQGKISLSEKKTKETFVEISEQPIQGDGVVNITSNTIEDKETSSFTNFRKGFLLEATAGFSRIGPSIGARYVFDTQKENNYWQLYLIWKF
jgi:PKD repeat protein